MGFQLSAGVVVSEVDLTTIIPAVSTTNGAFVGGFRWGPVDQRTLVASELDVVARFVGPDANSYLSFFSCANFLAYGNNLRIVRSVANTAFNASSNGNGLLVKNRDIYEVNYAAGQDGGLHGEWLAKYPGQIGNSLYVSICPSSNAFSQNLTAAFSGTYANTYAGNTTIQFNTNVAANGVSAGDLISMNGASYVKLVDLIPTGTSGNTATAVGPFTYASVNKKWQWSSYFNGAPGTSSYALSKAGANDEMHVIVVDTQGLFPPQGGTANNVVLEVFPYLSKAIDAVNGDGSSNYVASVIRDKSNYIWWMNNLTGGTNWGNNAANTVFTAVNNNKYTTLGGGVDGYPADGDLQLSWNKFINPEEVDVSLVISGNASPTMQSFLINNIVEVRRDCVLFLSPMQTDVVTQAGFEVTNITTTRNNLPSSSYAVMDCNWKYQFDKYNNIYRWLPLNADVAGLCVRTDAQRDPWWSPAGLNRGQIKNAIKLAWNPSKTDRDTLYPIGVNPVVALPGQGVVLYGDKTLQSKPSAFDRINVRRLFIVLEKAIAVAAKYSLFEFNDEFTRASFVAMVEPFLRDIQGRRGITDFRVVCDTTNNTQQVIDANQFVGDIYIKPARSINFIQLNFVAVRTGVDFNEITGKF